jgi:hypothetical protein
MITSTGELAASDFLSNTNIAYLNPGARGLEGGDAGTRRAHQRVDPARQPTVRAQNQTSI